MLKFLNHSTVLFFLFLNLYANSQQHVEIAIQQGHSDEITNICISNDNRFIASYGKDLKVVIWDLKSNNQFSYKQICILKPKIMIMY